MTKQLAFYFAQEHCSGCCTCQIACKDKNNLSEGQLYRKVHEYCGGSYKQLNGVIRQNVFAFWTSLSCNHCQKPACVAVCPTGALRKREEDGIVLLAAEKCVGCKQCTTACPYEALQFNQSTGKMGKCDFCLDLLEQGKEPACVAACPMRVLDYGLLKELQQKYGTVSQTQGMVDQSGTEPSLVITPHRHGSIMDRS
ncbi:MAG: DMSO/selenate family reductase complex B subunit [Sporomusaceae bacterium]|nr:DMSO/selenate family reductase complex B subunit [Sporomusaceae bacterium]